MRSNCLIFAIWRTIRRGGVLILQRSHAGPYLHAMWAERLPSDMKVEHFSPHDKSEGIRMEPLFIGSVAYHVGNHHSTPPKERWWVSPVFLFFWLINLLGWVAFLALLTFPIYANAGDLCKDRWERKINTCPGAL